MTTENQTSTKAEELAQIQAFEDRYNYDTTYMKEMLSAAPEAYQVFKAFLPMAQFRKDTPRDVYFTAKLAAFQHVDCGPCLQLAVQTAQEAGLDASLIKQILDPRQQLPSLLNQVRAFALAVLQGNAELEELRTQLLQELGEPVMAELALAIAAPQIFPAVKRATGHYQSCAITPLKI